MNNTDTQTQTKGGTEGPQAGRKIPARSKITDLLDKAKDRMRLFDPEGYEEAVALLRRVLDKAPENAGAYAALAEVYSHWGFRREIIGQESQSYYDLSLECATKALTYSPERADTHRAMAIALRRGKRADAGKRKEQILVALDLNPNDAANWYEYWRAFGYDTSDSSIHRTLELDPFLCGAQIDLGVALCEEGRLEEAMHHLIQALRSSPRNTLAAYNLAMVLDRMGEQARALAVLNKAKEQQPDDPLIKKGIETLGGGGHDA